MVEAIKPPIRASVASGESSTKCVVWRCPWETLHPTCWSTLDAYDRLPASSGPVVRSIW
ncbi:Putative DD34D transposase [Caligus rogercresseyi]|uniref:DD34D transposase n=1 Tax=Caligus rogercresseyi TaxID=217165 RepID=A0A7T8KKB3_CALRO|nr:Putative DD34D transposase [Caligus rogercresseyi]